MRELRASILLLLSAALMSCGDSKNVATIYVLAPPQMASRFTGDLAVVAKRHGLDPNPGQSTDDQGRTYWVLEATGNWLRLWSTNVPLSGGENTALCGVYTEGHPDPGQYIVTITPTFPLFGTDTPNSVIAQISGELKVMGYDIRKQPVECSPLSKAESAS